ncbi:hypothetical protein Leryth_014518 [Lithospermum erythrorhizon]|nr:hypothetical protein Leryth_014518 [Lithospermum erythrorhizon]
MTIMTPAPIDGMQPQEDEEMLVPESDIVEGPQAMEVASQADPGNSAGNQSSDDPQTLRFSWKIESFSKLNTKKHYSEVFTVGGYKWRILIFPKGNNVDYLSMYLDVADAPTLPYGWSRFAQFSLAIANQTHNKYTIRKG